MPKLQRPSGSFVTNEDVATGDIVTFTDGGKEFEEEDKFKPGKKRLRFTIGVTLPNGEDKVIALNNTSKGNIMDHYGEDSDKWVGKEARVEVVTQKVGNDFKDVVYLTAPGMNLKGELIGV